MQQKYVQNIILAPELDRKVASADVKIGDVTIRRLTVWRSGNGKLHVYLPSYPLGDRYWANYVDLPKEIRTDIEAEVIEAYKREKKSEKRSETTATERKDGENGEV